MAMNKLEAILRLLRPWQWYKNLVIFIAVVFTERFFMLSDLWLTLLGFFSLCLISSANYIINDLIDVKADKAHPEKKNRPLASGAVKTWEALILAVIALLGSVVLAATLSKGFTIVVLTLFVLTQGYSLLLKHEAFLDIITIGMNFVLRAMSGAYLINVEVSPWLIICAFFLALFLATGKRLGELMLLGHKAVQHKKVFRTYDIKTLETLMAVNMAVLIISYALYTFLKASKVMLFTIPIVLYSLYRYKHLIDTGKAREPEAIITDTRTVFAIFLWGATVLIALYVI
jgi:4-hydroxybenzoate polyprenyltransferase